MSPATYGVHPYAARPGVDVEHESVGAAMRASIWDLFESDTYCQPEDVRQVFESLFQDIAIEFGYWQDADGHWHRHPDYVYMDAVVEAGLETERSA